MFDYWMNAAGFGALFGVFEWLMARNRIRAMSRVENPPVLAPWRDAELRRARTAAWSTLGFLVGWLVLLAINGSRAH